MQHENMNRAYETGYTKFTEMAEHAWRIIEAATQLPDDFRVYFLAHTEDSEGKVRMKTVGKMLNEKLTRKATSQLCFELSSAMAVICSC
jgi:hypothetical protein